MHEELASIGKSIVINGELSGDLRMAVVFSESLILNRRTRNLGEAVESYRYAHIGALIVDGEFLRFLVDSEIRKAQRLRYCVSLVRMAADPTLPETARLSEPAFAERVAGHLRATDVVVRQTSTLTLLLVDADVASLPSIFGRLTTAVGIAWSAGGSCYPGTATRIEDLLRQAEETMLNAQKDGGRRLYLST